MNKIFSLLLFTLVFAACDTQNDMSDPNLVAQNFLNAYVTMDYTEAKKYATKEFGEELDQFEFENAELPKAEREAHKKSTAEIKGMEIMEAEGLAIVKYSNSHLPDIINQLELKKVENNWYVNKDENMLDKELDKKFPDDEMDEYMDEAEAQEEIAPVDTLEQ